MDPIPPIVDGINCVETVLRDWLVSPSEMTIADGPLVLVALGGFGRIG